MLAILLAISLTNTFNCSQYLTKTDRNLKHSKISFARKVHNIRGENQNKRFLLYGLYAWGVSMFIMFVCILSDQMNILPENLRPEFGLERCWFNRELSIIVETISCWFLFKRLRRGWIKM